MARMKMSWPADFRRRGPSLGLKLRLPAWPAVNTDCSLAILSLSCRQARMEVPYGGRY